MAQLPKNSKALNERPLRPDTHPNRRRLYVALIATAGILLAANPLGAAVVGVAAVAAARKDITYLANATRYNAVEIGKFIMRPTAKRFRQALYGGKDLGAFDQFVDGMAKRLESRATAKEQARAKSQGKAQEQGQGKNEGKAQDQSQTQSKTQSKAQEQGQARSQGRAQSQRQARDEAQTQAPDPVSFNQQDQQQQGLKDITDVKAKLSSVDNTDVRKIQGRDLKARNALLTGALVVDGDGAPARPSVRERFTSLAGHAKTGLVKTGQGLGGIPVVHNQQPAAPQVPTRGQHRGGKQGIDWAKTASLHAEHLTNDIETRIQTTDPAEVMTEGRNALATIMSRYGKSGPNGMRSEVVLGTEHGRIEKALAVEPGRMPSSKQLRLAAALKMHGDRVAQTQRPDQKIKLDVKLVATAGLARDALSSMGVGLHVPQESQSNFKASRDLEAGASLDDIAEVHFAANSFKAVAKPAVSAALDVGQSAARTSGQNLGASL